MNDLPWASDLQRAAQDNGDHLQNLVLSDFFHNTSPQNTDLNIKRESFVNWAHFQKIMLPHLLAISLLSVGASLGAEDETKKTVLITGGAGFIGHHVIEVRCGIEKVKFTWVLWVVCESRFMTLYDQNQSCDFPFNLRIESPQKHIPNGEDVLKLCFNF